jgi:hypothetical protein
MTRLLRCQLRPGAGKKLLPKNRPSLRSGVSRLHGLNVSRLERWGCPRPNLKAGVFSHAITRSGQPSNGVAAATRARVDAPSFFPYLFLYLSWCSLPASAGKPKTLARTQANPVPVNGSCVKTATCESAGELERQKVYRVSTFLSCRLLTTAASTSHLEPHREARTGRFRQILGSGEAAMELGDELHDVEPKPEVWPMITAGP